jgi:hypothetical protein
MVEPLTRLVLPESLAGKLEARMQLERESVDNFRRLDAFLGGILEAMKQMGAEVHSLKDDNARLTAHVKEVPAMLPCTVQAERSRMN